MSTDKWLSSNVEYGRKLVESGLTGANCGRKEFLKNEALSQFLQKSMQRSLKLTAVGAGLSVLGALVSKRNRKSPWNIILFGAAGAALGFVGGLTWETRQFVASMAHGAVKDVNVTRDEHWLEKNPIDYA